jgi:leucyl aminopeptidase
VNFTVKDKPVGELPAEAALVLIHEGAKSGGDALARLDELTGGQIKKTLARDPRCGQAGWSQILYATAGSKGTPERVILAGAGKAEGFTPEKLRQACGHAARAADAAGVKSLSVAAPLGAGDAETIRHVQAAVEGMILATYFFGEFKPRKEGGHLADVTLSADKAHASAVKEGVRRGSATGEAQRLARTLSELPGNHLPPAELAARAGKLAEETGLAVEIFDEKKLAKGGFHAILEVGKGSRNPPRLIVLEHKGGKRGDPPIALIGKGITFDSGGISLKEATPSNSGGSIDLMRTDKTGACTVIAAMTAIAKLGVKANVVGVAACAENMPSGDAYRPGDIIKTYAGKTVEIMSTDAEGRLVLADALAYTREKYKPKAMIDVATLTGACVIALGEHNIGLFANNDAFAEQVRTAAEYTGEPVWRLPLQEAYLEQTKSKIADLMNSGGRPGGAITAASFLWEFAGNDVPWVHLDIAGLMHLSKDRPYLPRGAVGIPTRTLIELVMNAAYA